MNFWMLLNEYSRLFRRITKYASMLSSTIAVFLLIIPKISIEAATNLTPHDAYGTLISIKNEGHVPAFNARLVCSFIGGPSNGLRTESHGANRLWPSRTIVRSCLTSEMDPATTKDWKVKVTLEYELVPNFLHWNTKEIFSIKSGQAGIYLFVPDVD